MIRVANIKSDQKPTAITAAPTNKLHCIEVHVTAVMQTGSLYQFIVLLDAMLTTHLALRPNRLSRYA